MHLPTSKKDAVGLVGKMSTGREFRGCGVVPLVPKMTVSIGVGVLSATQSSQAQAQKSVANLQSCLTDTRRNSRVHFVQNRGNSVRAGNAATGAGHSKRRFSCTFREYVVAAFGLCTQRHRPGIGLSRARSNIQLAKHYQQVSCSRWEGVPPWRPWEGRPHHHRECGHKAATRIQWRELLGSS